MDAFHWEQFETDGRTYRYVDERPTRTAGRPRFNETLVLVHGWPDSWYGWRRQIPFLRDLGFRVLVPAMIGYGAGTTSPLDLAPYRFKSVCADLDALLAHCKVRRAGFLGHDWGGMVVWRMYNYYPKRVSSLAVISTPYMAPAQGKYLSLEAQAAAMPNFAYQLWLASDAPAKALRSKDDWRRFFTHLYQPGKGMRTTFDNLASAPGPSTAPLLSPAELEVYVEQYHAQGAQTSTNWYRTRRLNYDDERADFQGKDATVRCPTLFIATLQDPVLKPALSAGMEQHIPKLQRAEVDTGHWGAIEATDKVNAYLQEFFMRQVLEKMRHSI